MEMEEEVETGIKKNNPENSSCQEIEKDSDLKLKSSNEKNGGLETNEKKNRQENMEIIKTSSHAQNGIDEILADSDTDILKSNDDSNKGSNVSADVKRKEKIDQKTSDSDSNKVDEVLSRSVRRRISINEAPEFIERLGSFKDSNVGEDVTLVCKFKAWPRPSVTWFRDDNEVKETARHSFENIFEGEESLAKFYIKDVDSRDEGCYKCRVENGEGFASTTGYLSVSGKSAKSDSDRSRSPSPSSRKGSSPGRRGDRSLTPSGLRPILEQKSIEEREAEEYRSLGPSPIQEFIDVVNYKRRGRLTKRAKPLVFCPAEFYSDDSSSFDQEDEEISATVQDTATDSDVTLSPDMTPTLTSSPELSDIWAHGPLKSAFLPNASNNAMQHAIQDTSIESLTKNTEKLIEGENFKEEFSSLDKPKTRSFENVSGTAEKTQIEGRTLNKGSLDSIISTRNDQNSRIPDSQYHSLADIQSKDIGSSHFVNPLPVWQTTSQVVYPMSDPRDKFMRMVDDSDYDSDTTPTSTPEVEISDPRLHVRYYTAQQNELNKSINQEQEQDCRESTPKNDPSNEISKSKADILSPVKLDGDKITDTTNTTQRIGRSLQERRLRMLSDTMRRATSETRAEDFCSARVTSPYKSLSVSIKTAARRPSLPNSGDTSGVVLLSADKPPGLDNISLAKGNSATTSNSMPLVAEKSPNKKPEGEISSKSVEKGISISSQQTNDLKKVEKVEEGKPLVSPKPTIRTTSRAVAKPASGNVRSRSVDITIRTSGKTPVENISSSSTEIKNASTKVIPVFGTARESENPNNLNIPQTKVISERKLEGDRKEPSNESVAKSEISQCKISAEQKSSIPKNTVIRTASRAVARPTHDNRRSRSVDITVRTSSTPTQNIVSSREENNCKVIVNNAEVGGELGPKIATSAVASSGRSVETADCEKLKQISSTGTDIILQKPEESVNAKPAIQEKQQQKTTLNKTEDVGLLSSVSVKPVLNECDTTKKVKEFEETETVSTVALSVSKQNDCNTKSDTNKFEIASKPPLSVEKITGYVVNNVDTATIILATSNIKEQITAEENLNKTVEINSSAKKSEGKSSFETSPKVISVSVRSPSPCTAVNILSRQVPRVDQRRQGASNVSRAVKISTNSAAENQILATTPAEVPNDLKITSAINEISFSKKPVRYNAETSESVSKATISTLENLRPLQSSPPSLKLLASNVIPKDAKDTRIQSKEKNSTTCVAGKDEKKLKDNIEEINYMRVVVDKVFNALNYANVQFYLLFISLATALAAASAASSGRTIFASFSPFLFVCSSVVAVIISEVTQFTRERKQRQQIEMET